MWVKDRQDPGGQLDLFYVPRAAALGDGGDTAVCVLAQVGHRNSHTEMQRVNLFPSPSQPWGTVPSVLQHTQSGNHCPQRIRCMQQIAYPGRHGLQHGH